MRGPPLSSYTPISKATWTNLAAPNTALRPQGARRILSAARIPPGQAKIPALSLSENLLSSQGSMPLFSRFRGSGRSQNFTENQAKIDQASELQNLMIYNDFLLFLTKIDKKPSDAAKKKGKNKNNAHVEGSSILFLKDR